MKRVLLAAAVSLLAGGAPVAADEITVGYEEFAFEATVTLPQFPCPTGCTGTGHLSVTSATGGPVLSDNVNVQATDSFGCAAGTLRLAAGNGTESTATTFSFTRAAFALAGTAVHDQYALGRVRNYVVEAAMVPASVDPAALAVACIAGAPLQNVTFTVTGVGERAEVRRTP